MVHFLVSKRFLSAVMSVDFTAQKIWNLIWGHKRKAEMRRSLFVWLWVTDVEKADNIQYRPRRPPNTDGLLRFHSRVLLSLSNIEWKWLPTFEHTKHTCITPEKDRLCKCEEMKKFASYLIRLASPGVWWLACIQRAERLITLSRGNYTKKLKRI